MKRETFKKNNQRGSYSLSGPEALMSILTYVMIKGRNPAFSTEEEEERETDDYEERTRSQHDDFYIREKDGEGSDGSTDVFHVVVMQQEDLKDFKSFVREGNLEKRHRNYFDQMDGQQRREFESFSQGAAAVEDRPVGSLFVFSSLRYSLIRVEQGSIEKSGGFFESADRRMFLEVLPRVSDLKEYKEDNLIIIKQ